MKSIILTVILFSLSIILKAQSHQIRGNVSDLLTGESLQFVNVYTGQLSRGAVTNENGDFIIDIPSGQYELTFGHIGYKTEKIIVKQEDSLITVKMLPASHYLSAVNIYSSGEKNNIISNNQLQNKQIEEYAGFLKDALRSVQLLPGVSTNNEATANFNVRGGSYDENLVLVNGVHVNEPFHLKEVPNASVGIFNIDMAKKIDFSAGGFGAENGDALSSVLKVDYKEGNNERYSGKVNLSMVDLGAIIEGPVSSNSTFIFGARKSYLKELIKMAGGKGDLNISYYDIQGVYSYKLTNTNKLNFCFIYSADRFTEDPETEIKTYTNVWRINSEKILTLQKNTYNGSADFDYSNLMASISSVNLISPSLSNEVTISIYNEKTNVNGLSRRQDLYDFKDKPEYLYMYNDAIKMYDERFNKTFAFKISFDFLMSSYNTLNFGFNYERTAYSIQKDYSEKEYLTSNLYHYPDTTILYYPADPIYNANIALKTPVNKYSGFIQDSWQLNDNLFLTAGLRSDYFDMNKTFVYSPRLNLSYIPLTGLSLKFAYGLFYQMPNYKQLKFDYPAADNTKNQKAAHYILGIEYKLSAKLNIKMEGYIKNYDDIIPVQLLGDGSLDYGNKENSAEGYARGADIRIISSFDWISFSVSYGYLTAKERLKGTEYYYPRYTDQAHTVSSIIDFDLGKDWNASLRIFYGSGYASPPSYLDKSSNPPKWTTNPYNAVHLPSYEREDLRISKEFKLFSRPMVVYLDVMNLLSKKNIVTTRYTYDRNGNPHAVDVDLFPIIPSLGVAYSF